MRLHEVFFRTFIFFLFQSQFLECAPNSLKVQNNLYYVAPEFDIKYANVTFAAARYYNESQPRSTLFSLGQTIASICQADLINRNQTQFSFSGLINLIFQNYFSTTSSGQGAALTLASTDMSGAEYYTAQRNYSADVAGMIGMYDYGTSKINSLVTNNFGIPFLASGDLARSAPDNQFVGHFPGETRTFFQTYNTGKYNTFNATLDLLAYFNWTAVGNVFAANSYGYARQRSVTDYAATSSVPLFACQTIYYFDSDDLVQIDDIEAVDSFCKCISEKDKIQVTVLWMGTTAAIGFLNILKYRCSASKDWTFIVGDDFQTPLSYTDYNDDMKNSLLIRGNGPWDVQSFLKDCQDGASPAVVETISGQLDQYARLAFNCTIRNEDDLKACTSLYGNSGTLCYCSSFMLGKDPYFSRYLFSADLISTYAEGIRLLANNCTFLNEMVSEELKSQFSVIDFCKLTKFTPPVLALALRFVNFTGYTGEIYFDKRILMRSIKTYFLYSAYSNNFDAVLVGTLNSTGVQINTTAIQFVNGKMPISSVVPQNPDLSYAIVDVFFAISIVFLVICLVLLVIFIVYRNNLSMRRTSRIITLAMFFGLICIVLAQLFRSFAQTSAICTINVYFYQMGSIVIIAGSFAKNYRIYRIFSNRTAKAVKISELSLLMFIIIVSAIYCATITAFVAIFGIQPVVFQSPSNIYYKYVKCVVPNDTWNTLLQYFLRLYILFFIILSLIMAWFTRRVKSEFRESKALTAFIIIIAAAFAILIPLELTFGSETDSQIFRYAIDMEFYTIAIVSALGLLFFPKVYYIYLENEKMRKR